jgi:putative lipoprotein
MYKRRVTAVLILAATMGCESAGIGEKPREVPPDSDKRTEPAAELHVEVFYRERMMLPPTAELSVALEDSAKMDVAAVKIAEATVPTDGAPPYRVTLSYEPSKLDPRGRYGVRARIENEGQLMFTSMQFNPAFGTHGSASSTPHDPVKVMVTRVAGGRHAKVTSITGTRWVFKTLHGEDAGTGAGGNPAHITLQGAEPRASGFAGCNQIAGAYELDGNALSFSKMAMTMRACPEGMDLDREVSKALEATQSYQISGTTLRLMDEDGAAIAELEAE